MSVSPDNRTLICGDGFGKVRMLRRSGNALEELTEHRGHGSPVACLAFAPDDALLASCGSDEFSPVTLWDLSARPPDERHYESVGPTPPENAADLRFSSDGRVCAVEPVNYINARESQLWRVTDGRMEWLANVHLEGPNSPEPERGQIGVIGWELNDDELSERLAALADDRPMLTLLMASRVVRVWFLDANTPFAAPVPYLRGRPVLLSPNGRWLATRHESAFLIWDLDEAKPVEKAHLEKVPGAALALSADGTRLVTAKEDGKVFLWDTASDAPCREPWQLPGAGARSAAFSHDGRYVAVGNENGTIYILDLSAPPTPPEG